jgi:hypothetical protein
VYAYQLGGVRLSFRGCMIIVDLNIYGGGNASVFGGVLPPLLEAFLPRLGPVTALERLYSLNMPAPNVSNPPRRFL